LSLSPDPLTSGATHEVSPASDALPPSPATHASAANEVSLQVQSPEHAATWVVHCDRMQTLQEPPPDDRLAVRVASTDVQAPESAGPEPPEEPQPKGAMLPKARNEHANATPW
jgi:hypothetical protein